MSATTRMHRILFFTVVPILWVLIGVVMPCHADLMLRVDNLDTPEVDVFVVDQVFNLGGLSMYSGASPNNNTPSAADQYSQEGAVGFTGGVGSFSMSVTVGLSGPLLGEAARMDLFNVTLSGGSGTLVVELWDTDFHSNVVAGGQTSFQTLVGGTTDGLFEIGTYADNSAVAFGTQYLLGGGTFNGEAVSDGLAFAGETVTALSSASLSGNYALGIRASITHTGLEVTSFDVDLRQVPEPAAGLLALIVLLVLGSSRPRRRS